MDKTGGRDPGDYGIVAQPLNEIGTDTDTPIEPDRGGPLVGADPEPPALTGAPASPKRDTPPTRAKEKAAPAKSRVARGTPTPPQSPDQQGTPSAPPSPTQQAAPDQRFVADEILFTARTEVTPQAVDELAREFQLTRITAETIELMGITLYRYRIPDQRSVPAVVQALAADRRINAVQPNYLFSVQDDQQPTAMTEAQYVAEILHLDEAHQLSTGERTLVAVIDSGIEASHPELRNAIAETFNALETPFMVHDHGTSVAGAIAAHGMIKGVAPKTRLLAVRAFSAGTGSPEGSTFHILRGLSWAWQKGARVVNLSFAGPRDPLLAQGLADARRHGLILVAAAGNNGAKSPPLFPAADPNVIAVTATDGASKLYQKANRGRHVLVSAPGVDVLAPATGGAYDFATGTSIAAAHVSGLIALMLDRDPTLDEDAVRDILIKVAKDLGPPGRDVDYGVGLPDAYKSLIAVEPQVAGPGFGE